ncbi:M15 family metallopeptidase [Rhizobium leguminosarum]|uniref:M15 family metallopeptidase n=1 Tax=Rhizobium leguminosarum TaxID=384 RepID=UPI001678392A|nr:M15 family metallopeptidase [Rhizobium leguminosarum]
MADFDWSPYAVGGATRPDALSGMNAQFRAALQGLISTAPHGIREQLQVFSGYRSPAKQAELYNRALQKYGSPQAARQWVAPPNKSQHNKGMAADLKYLSPQAKAWVRENAPAHGLSFPLKNEPWHVELATARNPNAAKPPMDIPNVTPSSASQSLLSYDAVPTPRPQSSPFDSILSPSAPTEQMATFRATPTPVQREALPDVTPARFDNSRFGAAPAQTFDQSRFGNPAPASSYFDYSGLLAEPDQPSQFDTQRMATGPVATTPQQLQRGLLDQQLNAGILPDLMAPATKWPGQVAPATTAAIEQPSMGDYEPSSIKTARVQAPEVQSGLLSQPEYQQFQQQQALLGGPMAHSTPAEMQAMAAQVSKGMQNRSLGGGLLGGLLGGLTLGPIGAIAGGLLGRNVAKNSYFPDAPKPSANSKNDRELNDYGRSVSGSSGQFSRAMASGGKGLY